jgi:hypothetical protein
LCDHCHFLICITWGLPICGPNCKHSWWFARYHLKGDGALWPNVPNCYSQTWLIPNGPPNLVDLSPHDSLGIVGQPSSLSQFVNSLELEWDVHLELRSHALPQSSPKLACELWVLV